MFDMRKFVCKDRFLTINIHKKMLQQLEKISRCNIFMPFCIIFDCLLVTCQTYPYSTLRSMKAKRTLPDRLSLIS